LFDNLHSNKEFGVHHFAGPVIYDASMFVERNTEKLPDFLISVVATSSNTLLSQVLGEVMKERTVATKSKRKLTKKTVIDVFQTQLKELMLSIEVSQSRYIKCVKPCNNLEVTKKIDHQLVLRQLRCSGLVAAIKLSRETFPNKLLFSTVARRFSCLLSAQTLTSTADMDAHDRTQVILTTVFAPLIETYQESSFSMPFACGRTKVFFRTGALETLERKRLFMFQKCAGKIQNFFRGFFCAKRYLWYRKECIRMQAHIRRRLISKNFKKLMHLVTSIQARVRATSVRKMLLKEKGYVICIQRWWASVCLRLLKEQQDVQLKAAAGTRISVWFSALLQSRRLKTHQLHAMVISTWIKARLQRTFFLRVKRAAILIAAWSRTLPILHRFKLLKKAAYTVSFRRRVQLAKRFRMSKILAITRIQTIVRSRQQMKRYLMLQKDFKLRLRLAQEHLAVTKLQSFVRSRQLACRENSVNLTKNDRSSDPQRDTLTYEQTSDTVTNCTTIVPKNGNDAETSIEIRLVPTRYQFDDQLLLYKSQIDELKNDITLLTSEAELHKQEVEADFEERLAEYEEEVLLLKQSVLNLEAEKINLKDEIAANVMIVGNLKTGIRSMQEAHREYLNKVMRAIDNANIEHQRALELVKQDRDGKVNELLKEIERVKKEKCICKGDNCKSNQADSVSIYELARKIENLTSPNVIAALCKKTRKLAAKEDYIDEKLSGKIRKLLYRIEDIATKFSFSDPMSRDQHQDILALHQQLADANNKIEKLQGRIECFAASGDHVARLRLKKFFER
jgi:Myosin head (motor domain)